MDKSIIEAGNPNLDNINFIMAKFSSTESIAELLVKNEALELKILNLQKQLVDAGLDMHANDEGHQAKNRVLQSDHDELIISAKELHFLNESLAMNKEELLTSNEALTEINNQYLTLNQELVESRDYAEAIVATVREPLLILDADLRVKTANSAYYRSFQVSREDTEGKLIYEVDNKQWNILALRGLLENILPQKSSFSDFEIKHDFAKIGTRILLLNAREIRKDDNSEKLILLAFEDVTEQRAAAEIQSQIKKRFKFIADAMPQKVWTADSTGNMDYFNKNWLDYSGLPFDSLKNWGMGAIIHPDDFEQNNTQWQHSIDTGENFEIEERFLSKEGEYKWHLSRGLSYKDENGKILMWVGTNTEIQEHMILKKELEESVVNRTYELLQANDSLKIKNTELEKMNSELHSFTYVSSHDLQEPLRKIQTFVNLMEREKIDLSEKSRSYLSRIHSSANRMQSLLKDLLAFSRINTADRKFEDTSLNKIIDEVKEDLADSIEAKQATFSDSNLGNAMLIPFQFRQLIYNLIGNSLKFSKVDLAPRISISCEKMIYSATDNPLEGKIEVGQTYTHIRFSDNGIGLDPVFIDRIFEVFQKLHPAEEYAGTGIGLAIVKRIVNNHQGFITVNTAPNEGVTFEIYLPAL